MYTISRLGKRFGLSRSTLLYYDSIGLLCPSRDGQNSYRSYSESDAKRLEQICFYRRAGLSLSEIADVLASPENRLKPALEKRLAELNDEAGRIREQQRLILGLLKRDDLLSRIDVMDKKTWVSLLAASGFSNKDMDRWHVDFERQDPKKHQLFLEFLGIPAREIVAIRKSSKDSDC